VRFQSFSNVVREHAFPAIVAKRLNWGFLHIPQKGSVQDQQGDLMGGAKGIAPLADLLPISGPCSLNAVLKAAGKIEEMLQGRSRPKKKKPQVPS
jgi:hypothetical protein